MDLKPATLIPALLTLIAYTAVSEMDYRDAGIALAASQVAYIPPAPAQPRTTIRPIELAEVSQ